MNIDIVTIFPGMFREVFATGMIRQAAQKGLLEIGLVDLREFADDRHRTVDDRPYGGGEGMVLKADPIFRAVESLRGDQPHHVALLSPQGKPFDQGMAQRLAALPRLALICGRYEGVDQRVCDHLIDEEISVGDFVLSGGEIAAMLIVDAVSRLIPGVLGNASSVLEDSFMHGLLDYPQYTRPAEYRGWKVPEVLLSGDHAAVRSWREKQALGKTRARRPDLLREPEAAPIGSDLQRSTQEVGK